jgi:general secretion pathway protein K
MMCSRGMSGGRGIALIAVLWVVAALTVIAAGMLSLVKGHTRALGTFQNQVVADTLGDAGTNLALRQILEKREQFQRFQRLGFDIEGIPVEVDVIPVSGLISLNGAQESLLTDLFVHGGGVAPEQAQMLAQRVIDWRDPDGIAMPKGAEDDAYAAAGSRYRTRGGRFQSPEDLLQVLGVDYGLYVRIASLVTVESRLSSVDASAAPEEVLRVLAGGDAAAALNYAQKRSGVGDGRFAVGGKALTSTGAGGLQTVFRLDARVALPGTQIRMRRQLVRIDLAGHNQYWKTLRVWPSVVVAGN